MGEPQQVSALPPPPMQYIKEYTDENIRKGLAPKPPPPIRDSYMMFGNQFQCDDLIIRPLESQGIERLHPMQFDHKRELKKLNMSILVNFLDLLDILIKSPGSIKREEKLEDIKLLFVHMHHLINEYRPHQARETLRVMMEVQKRQRLETAERFHKHLERVVEMIQSCLASLPDDLAQNEAPNGAGDSGLSGSSRGGLSGASAGSGLGAGAPGVSLGPRLKTEPMDVEEAGASFLAVGQQDKYVPPAAKKDKVWDKDAAMCTIIDEIA
ncbi:mediator of RNA polymerase II transcription subunit 7 [Aplochiton taeniatus]